MKRAAILSLLCFGCDRPPVLTVDMPLHLEDHLAAATITGSEPPATRFKPSEKVALTPEQLERLRALGYIR